MSTVNAETLPNARFFLNGVDVETLRSQSFSLLNDNLILNINRDLEGNYSCGFPIDSNNVQMSVPIPLVGKEGEGCTWRKVGWRDGKGSGVYH